MIELRTLGALDLRGADGRELRAVLAQPKRLALLAYLAAAAPGPFHRRDTLVALFWPDRDQAHARAALSRAVFFLRGALGDGVLVGRGHEELGLAPDRFACDAARFRELVATGRRDEALELYRGGFLEAFFVADAPELERWMDAERRRLAECAAGSARALARGAEARGDLALALHWARRAASHAPFDEGDARRVIELLARAGDRAGAVAFYERHSARLRDELELEPSAETRVLLATITAAPPETGRDAPPSRPIAPAVEPRVAPAARAPGDAPPVARARTERARRRMWIGGAAALVLATLGAGAWWTDHGPRRAAAAATLRERVIVADFVDRTYGAAYGELVAHVLRAELARSPRLVVVGQRTVDDALRRMRRPPDTRLDRDVAREVAAREKIKAIVEGEVRPAPEGFVVVASVVETATGDAIYGASEMVRDTAQLLAAVERLSDAIRRDVGGTIGSVRAGDTLAGFTTRSLAALRKHMAGSRAFWRGDFAASVALLDEATTLDPEFAHAYLLQRSALAAMGAPRERALAALERAYRLRGRLTERERAAVEGHYHLEVTGDLPAALVAFRTHVEELRAFPVGEPGWYASYGIALLLAGDLDEAERMLEGARIRFPSASNQLVLLRVRHALGKREAAARLLDELARRYPEHPRVLAARVEMLADWGRWDDAHALAERIRGDGAVSGPLLQAELDATRGRVGEAVGHLSAARDDALARGDLARGLEIAAAIGRLRVLAGDRAGAGEVDALLARHPIDSVHVLSRPYLPLAVFCAETGQPHRARAWLDAYARELPAAYRGPDRWMLHRARAAAYRAAGAPARALAELRAAERTPQIGGGPFDDQFLGVAARPEAARVHEALGAADSAIAAYERYLGARSLSRTGVDAFELGGALERLGALYERRGDRDPAAAAYARLAALWANGDPPFRRRARAAGARAAALVTPAVAGH